MNDKEWKDASKTLEGIRLSDAARSRIRRAIDDEERRGGDPSGKGSRPWLWWAGTLAAALAVAAVVLAGGQRTAPAPAGHGNKSKGTAASTLPSVADLLPKSGVYALENGATLRWEVQRTGSSMTLKEYQSGAGPTTQPAYIYDFTVTKSCLEQTDVRTTRGTGQKEAFTWFCVPPRSFTDAYDNADHHVTEQATETYVQDSPYGAVLHVHMIQKNGPSTNTIDRFFKAGAGLVKETTTNAQGHLVESLQPVPKAFASRPILKTLTAQPFGSMPEKVPFRLLAPPGLPFSTYVPTISKLYPHGFAAQSVTVGGAQGVIFGDLQAKQMVTEAVFLPKGTSKADALANMRKAEASFEGSPWNVTTWKRGLTPAPSDYPKGQMPWILVEDDGSNPHRAVDLGSADLGMFQGQYFYLIRTGWYEQANLPLMQEWEWANGTSFSQGVTKAS